MEALFEYMVPITGFFKKQRNPKYLTDYKKMDEEDGLVEDFKNAKSFYGDTIRVGKKCIYRKEKVTIIYNQSIAKATAFRVGSDASDSGTRITFTYIDGSEDVIFDTSETDMEKVTKDFFAALNEAGVKTTYR